MPRENRSYRKRSRSRSPRRRSPDRLRRSRSRDRLRRSRSPDRTRRSRSRERRRSRSRERKRSRDRKVRPRSRERRRSRSKERKRKLESPERPKIQRSSSPKPKPIRQVQIEGAILVKDEPLDKEAEQKRLEQEMEKRRNRIEMWRSERKQNIEEVPLQIIPVNAKKWSLEDESEDDDDEDGGSGAGSYGEDQVDPLDAYMQVVNEEVKSRREPAVGAPISEDAAHTVTDNKEKGKVVVTIVSAMATKKTDDSKVKGELMEGNMDAMEYSSEDEEENLEDTMSKLIRKKKELVVVDHNRIYYRPFRKEFYVEVPEIVRMTPEEVIEFREGNESIKVRGKNCPKPIKAWSHAIGSRKILDVLKKYGFEKPTPIQCQAIPCIMSGRDIIGIAKTGSGKTLAFLMPMFRHIADQEEIEEGDGPIAVILTPTRELATQIGKECRRFTKAVGIHVVTVYGGTGISEQIAELKRGTQIIVCTPGRMIDMLAANSGRVTNLRRCTYVVLDEADRMFDMGFEPQVMRIMDNIRPDRQTVMFSATFPRQMEALARKILQKPIEVLVGGRSVVCKEVEQNVVVLEEDKKLLKLLELLGLYQEQGSVLVFVDKQEHADDLMKDLMRHSYPCMSLHGGIDQYDRDSVIIDFKAGNIKMLVATSIAARGLDVKDLILVVNFDCPNHYEDYVHRCGRTGRAGNHGHAYTFLTPDQGKYANEIMKALTMSGSAVPQELTELWEEYKKQAELEGRKIRTFSGFLGKGFKFDETEAQLAADRKKIQKAALGLQDSDDEDAGMDIDQKIEDMFASRKRVTDVAKPLISENPAHQSGSGPIPMPSNKGKLELAKKLASQLHFAKKMGPGAPDVTQQAAAAFLSGGMSAPLVSSKTIAEQMAEKINAKLNYRPPQEEEKEQEPSTETFKRYEEELDINEFPQTARWKVTSKEALAQICEYSEAGITVRGTYVQPGKEAKDGERPLYLAIEATSEMAIQKAKKEITRLIKEELIRLQNSYQPINKGRYKVMT